MDIWKFSLHWGWNPVIFFVILIASLALVLVAKKRVLWLVPALVMYFGLDWALPMSWFFKLVFWLGVIFVLVTAFILRSRTRLGRFPLYWVSALVAVILGVGGLNAWATGPDNPDPPSTDSTASSSTSPTASPTEEDTATPEGLDENKLAGVFATKFKKLGFKPGEVSVGKVNWKKNPIDHRQGAFGDGVKSQEELTKFLNSDTPEGQAARRHVLKATPESEHERVLNGDNYIPIQYNVDIRYGGNATWVNGKLVRGGKVVAEAGDVFWVFVGSDYKIYWDAAVRADCENPGLTSPPRPHRPPDFVCEDCGPGPGCPDCTPPPECTHNCTPPPEECPPGQHGTPPLCKDGPENSPEQNGNAPEGGGHNDHNGPGVPNSPTQPPSTPHTNPPAPTPSPTQPSPTQPPEGGGGGPGGPSDNPSGDPGPP